ncbi:DMT family transporter [Elusimicrobiota bacterium]
MISYTLSWILLYLGITASVTATTLLKVSVGLTKLWPTVGMFICYLVALWVFSLALKTIDIGIGYAIWGGIGTVLLVIIGMVFFKEQIILVQIFAISMIVIGSIILNLSGNPK